MKRFSGSVCLYCAARLLRNSWLSGGSDTHHAINIFALCLMLFFINGGSSNAARPFAFLQEARLYVQLLLQQLRPRGLRHCALTAAASAMR